MSTNIVPSMEAAGSFEAAAPFDRVVNPDTYYSVEAIRSITEMQGLNINIFARVFQPVGVTEEMYGDMVTKAVGDRAFVISLIPRKGPAIYVLSTYLKSFPLIDGFSYERMVLVADLGPLPIDMKDSLALAQDHMKEYIMAQYGIVSDVKLGTIPTIGYVSQFEHDTMEATRKNRITDSVSDVAKIKRLEDQIAALQATIINYEEKFAAGN